MEKIERLIHIEGEIHLFSFQRIYTSKGDKYFISTVDKELNPYFFNMVNKGDCWRIVNAPEVPSYVLTIEKELSDIINLNSLIF